VHANVSTGSVLILRPEYNSGSHVFLSSIF